jgi:hypothetical protein
MFLENVCAHENSTLAIQPHVSSPQIKTVAKRFYSTNCTAKTLRRVLRLKPILPPQFFPTLLILSTFEFQCFLLYITEHEGHFDQVFLHPKSGFFMAYRALAIAH